MSYPESLEVREGLSFKIVPVPVKMASLVALSLWTSFRDISEVIHLLSPESKAIPPSRPTAILAVIKGLFFSNLKKNPLLVLEPHPLETFNNFYIFFFFCKTIL